jgi:hypothetical protein
MRTHPSREILFFMVITSGGDVPTEFFDTDRQVTGSNPQKSRERQVFPQRANGRLDAKPPIGFPRHESKRFILWLAHFSLLSVVRLRKK